MPCRDVAASVSEWRFEHASSLDAPACQQHRLSMSLLERITVDSNVCHGKPCIRGMRYPVETLLELMSSGMSSAEILADYPDLAPEDLQACLVYATRLAQTRSTVALAS